MRNHLKRVSALLLAAFVVPCAAQERLFKQLGRHLGRLEWSQTVLIGANAADVWTSARPGLVETNPLLAQHGHFNATSALIKFTIVDVQLFSQRYFLNHHPDLAGKRHLESKFAILNYAISAAYAGVAAHNAELN